MIAVSDSPSRILAGWNTAIESSRKTIEVAAKAVEANPNTDLRGTVATLQQNVEMLRKIREVAQQKIANENRCYWCSRQAFLTVAGTALDLSCKLITAGFWGNAAISENIEDATSFTMAGLGILSLITSRVRDRILKRQEILVRMLGQMEEIIPNQAVIDDIEAAVSFFSNSRGGQRKKTTKSQGSRERFQSAIHRVINQRRDSGVSVRDITFTVSSSVREKYVARLFWVYERLDGEMITELQEKFAAIRDLAQSELQSIKKITGDNPEIDVTLSVSTLEGSLEELRSVFSTVKELLALHEELAKGKVKCIAKNFGTLLEIILELASLASAIISAISTTKGSANSSVAVAGSFTYLTTLITSIVNTAMSKLQVGDAETYQQLKRLEGQEPFMKQQAGVVSFLKVYQGAVSGGEVDEEELREALAKPLPQALRSEVVGTERIWKQKMREVAVGAPQLCHSSSALQQEVDALAGSEGKRDEGWKQYIRTSPGSTETTLRPPSTGPLSIPTPALTSPPETSVTVNIPTPPGKIILSPRKTTGRGLHVDDLLVFSASDTEEESDLESVGTVEVFEATDV